MRKDITKKFLMREDGYVERLTSLKVCDFFYRNKKNQATKKKDKSFQLNYDIIEFTNIFDTQLASLNLKNDVVVHKDKIKKIASKGQVNIEFDMIYCGNFYYMKESYAEGTNNYHNFHVQSKMKKPFLMCEIEVTQELYELVMGYNPSRFQDIKKYPKAPKHPVDNVTWYDCILFCNKLSELQGIKSYYKIDMDTCVRNKKEENKIESINWMKVGGNGYRLPYDDEWEYVAKADTQNKISGFNNIQGHWEDYAWFKANSKGQTHPVATKKPNEWGFYDMSGNVYEWCSKYANAWFNSFDNFVLNGGDIDCDLKHDLKRANFAMSNFHVIRQCGGTSMVGGEGDKTIGFRICRNV